MNRPPISIGIPLARNILNLIQTITPNNNEKI